MTYEEEIAAMDITTILAEFDHIERQFDFDAEEEYRAQRLADAHASAKAASRERLEALYKEIDSRGLDWS